MSEEIKTMRQANDRLAALGQKRQVFHSLKQAQATVAQAEQNKPTAPKPFPTRPNPRQPNQAPTPKPKVALKDLQAKPPGVGTVITALSAIGSLKAAIKAEANVSAKINLLSDLRSKLLADMTVAKTVDAKNELQREFMATEKKLAYNLLSLKTTDPKAYKAMRWQALADRE